MMNIREQANKLVANLGSSIRVDGLAFDENSSCIFLIGDDILFILEFNEDCRAIVFNIVLGNLPVAERQSVLYELLTSNFYWNRTQGGTIGVDEQTDIVTMCYVMYLPLENGSDFEFVVEKLANAAQHWIDRLLEAGKLDKPGNIVRM